MVEKSLAYAPTIHKAQDSEYPIVIMPLTMQYFVMLQRNGFYTGVTRAKRIFIVKKESHALLKTTKLLIGILDWKDELKNTI